MTVATGAKRDTAIMKLKAKNVSDHRCFRTSTAALKRGQENAIKKPVTGPRTGGTCGDAVYATRETTLKQSAGGPYPGSLHIGIGASMHYASNVLSFSIPRTRPILWALILALAGMESLTTRRPYETCWGR